MYRVVSNTKLVFHDIVLCVCVCTGVHFNVHTQNVVNQHRSIRDKVRYKPTAELKVYLKVSKVQENRRSTFEVVSSHGWWIIFNFHWLILIVLVESVISLQYYHFSDQHCLAIVLSPALLCSDRLSSRPARSLDFLPVKQWTVSVPEWWQVVQEGREASMSTWDIESQVQEEIDLP